MKQVLAFAAVAAICAAAPAHAVIITDTGATLGSSDPSWSVMWRGILPDATAHGALTNAPIVTSTPSPPWQPNIATNHWLGVNSGGSIGSNGDGARRYEYAFTTAIELDVATLVTGAVGWDNFFVGGFIDGAFNTATGTYTPGTQFASTTSLLGAGNDNDAGFCRDGDGALPSGSYPNCTVNFAFNLPAGAYNITFVVQGDGVTDGFLLNQQGVTVVPQPTEPTGTTSVPEPGSLTLLVAGLAALVGRRRTRA